MKNNIDKKSRQELEYLIWTIQEKIRRTKDEEVRQLLNHQLEIWKAKLTKN